MGSSEKQLNKNGDRRGMSPSSRRNLENGRNKNGRRAEKGFPITSTLRSMIDEPCPERWLHVEDKGKGLTYRQAIAKTILSSAVAGKPGIISELLDRLEGKVTQPIGGEGGKPIEVEIDAKGKLTGILNRLAARAGEAKGDKESESTGS